jgi:cytochrome b561
MRAERTASSGTGDIQARHPRVLVLLHWLTALCLVLAAAFILTRDQMDGRTLRMWLLEGHRHFGLFILILFFVRLVVRLRTGRLPAEENTAWPLRVAAGLTHVALYALLLAQPLLGWALTSAAGKTVDFFGIALPALVAEDEDLADTLHTWHENTAWALLILICLHAGAALWHHFVMRDGVLRRMSPRRPR